MIELNLIKNETSIDIQLHFYFEDKNLHSMDAVILNESEKQFIDALRDVNKYLDKPLDIQIYAKKEGGLIETIQVIFEQPVALILITAIATNFFKSQFRQKLPNSEERKNQFESIAKIKEAISAGNLTPEEFDLIAHQDKKLKKLKSNFFRVVKKQHTLTHVELNTNTKIQERVLFDTITVQYEDFETFIIKDDEIQDETFIIEGDARIFIISPILFKGKWASWKGFLHDISIDFTISDTEFLKQVYKQEIKFGNGTYIDCVLKSTTIKNINKENVTRVVTVVNGYGDDLNYTNQLSEKLKILATWHKIHYSLMRFSKCQP